MHTNASASNSAPTVQTGVRAQPPASSSNQETEQEESTVADRPTHLVDIDDSDRFIEQFLPDCEQEFDVVEEEFEFSEDEADAGGADNDDEVDDS